MYDSNTYSFLYLLTQYKKYAEKSERDTAKETKLTDITIEKKIAKLRKQSSELTKAIREYKTAYEECKTEIISAGYSEEFAEWLLIS